MNNDLANQLMSDFARDTGVIGEKRARRYLWTDAFAVCNFLGLDQLEMAANLVEQVHRVLGRHHPNDPRQGWISGLPEEQARTMPTVGGLRIGKPLNERKPGVTVDPQQEWDRDGQYFHYLTKWMHVLNRMGEQTGESEYLRWANQLAARAHKAFTYRPSPDSPPRMYWKMSIDLSRPLVSSMGQHDPLDALVTYVELQSDEQSQTYADLTEPIAEATTMCTGLRWATDDSLGIGGILGSAARLVRLRSEQNTPLRSLVAELFVAAQRSLKVFRASRQLETAAQRRLAFRELGLAIGLQEVERTQELLEDERELHALAKGVLEYLPLADQIQGFWSNPVNREASSWSKHHDINSVMLATSFSLEGYLGRKALQP